MAVMVCVFISDVLSPARMSICLMFQTVPQCRKRKLSLGCLLWHCLTEICCTWH